MSHEGGRLAVTVTLLLRGNRAREVGEDLAGANDQVGDLGLGHGRVLGFDDGDASLRGFGAGLGRGLGDLGRLGCLGGRCLHAGGRRVEGGLGGVLRSCILGFGGRLRVRGLCPGLVGRAEGVPRGGLCAGGGDDLVEGGGQGRGDRAEEGLRVLGVGLQGGGDDRGGRVGGVEGDAAVRQQDRAVRGGGDLHGRGGDDDRAARVREGTQERFELGAGGRGQGDGVFDEEDLGAGHDRAGDEGLEALPFGELGGAHVDALGEAGDLQGAHEVVPVGDGARRGQGCEDVLADRQGLVERGVRADQRDRADAAREARG